MTALLACYPHLGYSSLRAKSFCITSPTCPQTMRSRRLPLRPRPFNDLETEADFHARLAVLTRISPPPFAPNSASSIPPQPIVQNEPNFDLTPVVAIPVRPYYLGLAGEKVAQTIAVSRYEARLAPASKSRNANSRALQSKRQANRIPLPDPRNPQYETNPIPT